MITMRMGWDGMGCMGWYGMKPVDMRGRSNDESNRNVNLYRLTSRILIWYDGIAFVQHERDRRVDPLMINSADNSRLIELCNQITGSGLGSGSKWSIQSVDFDFEWRIASKMSGSEGERGQVRIMWMRTNETVRLIIYVLQCVPMRVSLP